MRRLSSGSQIAVVGVILAALLFLTPVGTFVRSIPVVQTRSLVVMTTSRWSMEERRRAALGRDYAFAMLVRSLTPPDAIILMTDHHAHSFLEPLKGKSQRWMTYYLYPRRLLYLHQNEIPWYREAKWLIVDDPAATAWIAPGFEVPAPQGPVGCVPFDMDAYLRAIEEGKISAEHVPPFDPLPGPTDAESGDPGAVDPAIERERAPGPRGAP